MKPAAWVERVPCAVVVRIGGEIDLATVEDVAVALDAAAATVPPGSALVVDAGAVTFLSAGGVRVLTEVYAGLHARGAEMMLVAPSHAVLSTFRAARETFQPVGLLRLRDLVGTAA